ncbi:ArsR/SmtB family transcription factor [Effusibacillus lacus]|nr:metalloregulator ArsR/SmtB family transcription factor [Effusibacillus lacus]TCS76810.1 cadmium-sensing regulator CadC [Effusibacillus lacus]
MSQYQPTDVCEIFCYDEAKVNRLRGQTEVPQGISSIFKALADDTRFRIAYALSLEDELCVCDVANIIGTTVANASHHLRVLRNNGLASHRKEGKMVFYALADAHVKTIIRMAFDHSQEMRPNAHPAGR